MASPQSVERQEAPLGPHSGECCVQPGTPVKGTYFLGGAGMNGSYIEPLVRELRTAGIHSAVYLDRQKWSAGTGMDAAVGSVFGRDYDPRFPMRLRHSEIRSGQFNLIGYSYGSVIAAQVAAQYADAGTVIDHLVLIGSPISSDFLLRLKNQSNIKQTVVINLNEHGDPIYAGMHILELYTTLPTLIHQMPQSTGHFYYADPSKKGERRRKELAKQLYEVGLR